MARAVAANNGWFKGGSYSLYLKALESFKARFSAAGVTQQLRLGGCLDPELGISSAAELGEAKKKKERGKAGPL